MDSVWNIKLKMKQHIFVTCADKHMPLTSHFAKTGLDNLFLQFRSVNGKKSLIVVPMLYQIKKPFM